MKYSETHEWVTLDGEEATVGISEFVQEELGEIVYVELPHVGHQVEAKEEIVVLESSKAAADIYTPLSGKITAVNTALLENPSLINQSPEAQGWLFKIKVANPSEYEALMSQKSYKNYLK